MTDLDMIIENLSRETWKTAIEACAKIADLHTVSGKPISDYARGYDEAARAIAAHIRELRK